MSDPRYPIGQYRRRDPDPEGRREWIGQIRALSRELHRVVDGLDDTRLDTPYREGGWTVRQVVHHLPDSHLNGYLRVKLILTEDEPPLKTYDEARWAELPDNGLTPVATSLNLLEALQERWADVFETVADHERGRAGLHPERGRITIDDILQLYAWHGRHHVGHITALRAREGW